MWFPKPAKWLLLLLVLTMPSNPVTAYQPAAALNPENWWQAWNWNPLLAFLIGLSAWRYQQAVIVLRRRKPVPSRQVIAFGVGIAALFLALVSPLDALADELLSAHMIQHLLLMLVAAPLLVYSAPPSLLVWAMPSSWRRPAAQWWHQQSTLRKMWRGLTGPVMVWIGYAATLWGWHVPGLYQAALSSDFIHSFEHFSFLAAALLFWWRLLPHPANHRLRELQAVLYTFTTGLHSGLLGVLMTFSTTTWYPHYRSYTTNWGLLPLEDQQLAGVTMWVPAGLVYLVTALLLLGSWLYRMEQRDQVQRQ